MAPSKTHAAATCAALASLLASGMAAPASSSASTSASSPLTVQLDIFRHGISCSNYLQHCSNPPIEPESLLSSNITADSVLALGGCAFGLLTQVRDPLLTDDGVAKSTQVGAKIAQAQGNADHQPDMVLASSLLRAMETAYFMFPNATVYQVPYTKEDLTIPYFGEAPEWPLSIADQKVKLESAGDDISRFDFSHVQANPGECTMHTADANPRCVGDLQHFIKIWLPNMLMNSSAAMPAAVKAKIAKGEAVHIALVSHGDLIKRQILSDASAVASGVDRTSSVQNNRGFRATFTLQQAANNGTSSSWELTRQSQWDNVYGDADGVSVTCKNSDPAHYYERCTKDNTLAWAAFQQMCLT